jgi:hypothetical protein
MDINYLNRGEKIAGLSGVLLILIMFIFDWFGPKGATDLGGTNAWQSYAFTDILLFITALVAIALALSAASDAEFGLPVALSAIVTALGIISVILVFISIISPPDYDIPGVAGTALAGAEVETSIKIGVILGLLATIGITVGGYLGMQEEGTSFAGEADRFRGGGTGGPGAGGPGAPGAGPPQPPPPSSNPPPPPPSAPPPPSNPPPPSSGP